MTSLCLRFFSSTYLVASVRRPQAFPQHLSLYFLYHLTGRLPNKHGKSTVNELEQCTVAFINCFCQCQNRSIPAARSITHAAHDCSSGGSGGAKDRHVFHSGLFSEHKAISHGASAGMPSGNLTKAFLILLHFWPEVSLSEVVDCRSAM